MIMARGEVRKKKKVKSGKKRWAAAVAFFNNGTVRFLLGSVLALFALYTLVCLVSYLFTWAEDQSLLSDENLMTTIVEAENIGGQTGFVWANFLVSKLFGIGAFIVPVFLGGLSLACFRRYRVNLTRLFLLSIFGCIVLSVTFAYIFSFTSSSMIFGEGAGGSYGHAINRWLVSMTGRFGAGCIILFSLLLWAVLMNNRIIYRLASIFDSCFPPRKTKSEGEGGDGMPAPGEDSGEGDKYDDGDTDVDGGEDGENGEDGEGDLPVFDVTFPDEPETGSRLPDGGDAGNGSDTVPVSGGLPGDPPAVEIIPPDSTDISGGLSDSEWKELYDPRLSLSNYRFPDLSLLNPGDDKTSEVTRDELEKNNRKIVNTLRDYKIQISKISARIGPTVTLYEIVPAPGVRVSQIKRLEEDIALSLAATGVRVVTLLGTSAIGIEVPNEKPRIVAMRSVLEEPKFRSFKADLPVVLGRTISNDVFMLDLAKMPHLLVAGATGQGKSVGLNAIIASLLYKKHPAELKFVLVDPKQVELSLYSPLVNHYLAKLPEEEEAIVTDTQKVIYTLRSLCKLMDRRYKLLKQASVRDIKAYNEKFLSRRLNPYKGHEYMPYIVVIIDEFADMLMTAGREIEEPIARIAQLARAVGIHLVIATQRPSANIITGTIKANFPSRIAFKVSSAMDSKIILDQTGAHRLIGRGDMLVLSGANEPVRVQCAFIDTQEVERVASFIHSQPGFAGAYMLPEYSPEEGVQHPGKGGADSSDRDEMFAEAARLVVREQSGSTSLIQRKLSLGYNRAGRIMDQLEEAGIVGPPDGAKPRQVRITSLESLELILSNLYK